jgi:hypothetical protein
METFEKSPKANSPTMKVPGDYMQGYLFNFGRRNILRLPCSKK